MEKRNEDFAINKPIPLKKGGGDGLCAEGGFIIIVLF